MFNRKQVYILSSVLALCFGGILFAADKTDDKQKNPTQATTDSAAATSQAQDVTPDDVKKASQAFGHFIGKNLNTPAMQFDVEKVIQGIRDGIAGKEAPLTDKEYEALMLRIQKKAFDNLSSSNLKAADEFMVKNAKEPNVKEIEPNKLQYMVLVEGKGPVVDAHATPSINYVGKYIDGTVFGSSEEAGGPINIPLDQTIPGFSKGIQGMKEGEKRRLFVHPSMGYGAMGQLPPNSLLIFDIEVVKASNPKEEAMNDDDELLPLALEDESDDMNDDEEYEDEDESENDKHSSTQSKQTKPSTSTLPNKDAKK